jgi:hypothetical protein
MKTYKKVMLAIALVLIAPTMIIVYVRLTWRLALFLEKWLPVLAVVLIGGYLLEEAAKVLLGQAKSRMLKSTRTIGWMVEPPDPPSSASKEECTAKWHVNSFSKNTWVSC